MRDIKHWDRDENLDAMAAKLREKGGGDMALGAERLAYEHDIARRVAQMDAMLARLKAKPWIVNALSSEVPDRWRLACAELLDAASTFEELR